MPGCTALCSVASAMRSAWVSAVCRDELHKVLETNYIKEAFSKETVMEMMKEVNLDWDAVRIAGPASAAWRSRCRSQ